MNRRGRAWLLAACVAVAGCGGSVEVDLRASKTTAVTSGCAFSVNGGDETNTNDANVFVVGEALDGSFSLGLSCRTPTQALGMSMSKVRGVGSYPSLGTSEFETWSISPVGQTYAQDETFDAPAGACTIDLTVAPATMPLMGMHTVAGTFSCPLLADQADPSDAVSIEGSFSLIAEPVPQ
jgi:hypothetical protein